MAHNAFDTAQEVLADGFTGQGAIEEWMSRIEQAGERYCPLAYEQLAATESEATLEEQAEESASAAEDFMIEPLFDGELVFDDVPGEPAAEGE